MVSNIVNYYRGPLHSCPHSARGGDRPPQKATFGGGEAKGGEGVADPDAFLGPEDHEEIRRRVAAQQERKREAEERRAKEVRGTWGPPVVF